MNLENQNLVVGTGTESSLDYDLAPTYVANAFTKTEDKVNLEVDNANIACLTSKNNKFSLDEDGNLVVHSLTCNNTSSGSSINLLDVYPIGSIYLSVNNTNPNSLFGGVWEQWANGCCLIGVDSNQTEFDSAEKTGGEKFHTLTIDEMPSHNHAHTNYDASTNSNLWEPTVWKMANRNSASPNRYTTLAGGGQAHNNLQPYITCYMWKRVA